jgi:hypothetical protein
LILVEFEEQVLFLIGGAVLSTKPTPGAFAFPDAVLVIPDLIRDPGLSILLVIFDK